VVCGAGFNVDRPNAGVTIRLGYCNGFAEIGVRYRLVEPRFLAQEVERCELPIVSLSCHDYPQLNRRALRLLRRVRHFVWVDPWFDGMTEFYAERRLDPPPLNKEIQAAVLDSEPSFLWGTVPPSGLEFYGSWENHGARVVSLPLACDTTRYFPDPADQRFSDVRIAFVGGYWPYKNIQYEKYLRPYEAILRVYGYNRWPYAGYVGQLADQDERVLYQNASLSPALSEPHAEFIGDIVERPFKVMGSGGFTITDAVPFYRELFSPSELLVPSSVDEYHDMVSTALTDKNLNHHYRTAGFEAILRRHTYAHRAHEVMALLRVNPSVST